MNNKEELLKNCKTQNRDTDFCILKLVEKFNDPELCSDLSSDDTKDFCYMALASINNDESFCKNVKLRNNIEVCYFGVAIQTKRVALCSKIRDISGVLYTQDICLKVAGIEEDNPEYTPTSEIVSKINGTETISVSFKTTKKQDETMMGEFNVRQKLLYCGDYKCKEPENPSNCPSDCKSLLYGTKNRKIEDFAIESFFYNEFKVDETQVTISPKGLLELQYYKTPEGFDDKELLVSIDVYKGTENYDYFEEAMSYWIGYSRQDKYGEEKVMIWNEATAYIRIYDTKDSMKLCDPNKFWFKQVADVFIPIPSQKTLVQITFWTCFDIQKVEKFVDEYLKWLSDPDTKSNIKVS